MKEKLWILSACFLGIYFFLSPVSANQKSWPNFIHEIREEALEQGIRPEVFDRAFQGIKGPNKKVLHYDPEPRIV